VGQVLQSGTIITVGGL